ncbi:MAG TPA: hypothetical protein VI759_10740 [Dehalococcoidia bacterium]|nr:hypothetical protein [Dehalococcoidia bacterium]
MQYVSLVAGLVVAVAAFFAIGGWESRAAQRADARPGTIVAAYSPPPRALDAAATAPVQARDTTTPPPSILLLIADSQDAGNTARLRYAAAEPGWQIDLIVFEPGQNASDLDLITDSLSEAKGRGEIERLKIVYVRGG